ncbi:TorF family putative porin [Sphingomonas bacterium]|uniref:TorF family putative porin n=1 Tax=Sphingomonas bacterium TaxID=1895847 RepID=UPI00157649F7|nr:TorF family putative porin [Sphingomonas bacterium]
MIGAGQYRCRGAKVILALPLLAAISTAARAQDTAPPSPFTIAGGATLTSDYRFRGLSRSDTHAAIQGTLSLSHASGLYVGTWGSSIDDHVAAGSDQEIDLYGGYRTRFGGWTFDGGLLYYYFAGNAKNSNTDFFEPYLNASYMLGPVGFKLGMNYGVGSRALSCVYDPRCRAKSREDNLYTYVEVSSGIPNSGVTLTGHIGETMGRSYLTNGLKNYTDWSLSAGYTWKALTLSVSYVDTDVRKREIVSPAGRNIGGAGVVGAVSVAF